MVRKTFPFLQANVVAEQLGVDLEVVSQLTKSGDLPHVRLGNLICYQPAAVDALRRRITELANSVPYARPKSEQASVMTEEEAAIQLRIHPATLGKVRRRGDITYVSVGRQIRYRQSDIDAYLERNTQPVRSATVQPRRTLPSSDLIDIPPWVPARPLPRANATGPRPPRRKPTRRAQFIDK